MSKIDIQPSKTPNIGFVCTVEKGAGGLVYREYPIPDVRELLVRMEVVAADDRRSVVHLQQMVPAEYGNGARFSENFLAPLPYADSMVECVHAPEWTDREEYRADRSAHMLALNSRNFPEGLGEIRATSVSKTILSVKVPKAVYVDWYMRDWDRRLKILFVQAFRRYVLAVGYAMVLDKNNIYNRLGRDVLMLSTDTIGWTTYRYNVSTDISIRFDSNFGYGNSSYFFLSVFYKGVEIVPFSAYVRYRYANVRTLMRHTRSYDVTRASWKPALEFVAETANFAARSPDDFVRERVWGEVESMVEGLKRILQMRDFDEDVFETDGERVPYLGVSVGREDSPRRAIKADETLVLLKAEKVVGAMGLLSRLRAFSAIATQVSSAVSSIVGMVHDILPDVAALIKDVGADIPRLAEHLKQLRGEEAQLADGVSKHERLLAPHFEKIHALEVKAREKARSQSQDPRELQKNVYGEVERKYAASHAKYRALKEELKKIQTARMRKRQEVCDEEQFILERKRFLVDLKRCYGIGAAGDRFLEVLVKLDPHLARIEDYVEARLARLGNKVNVEQLRVNVTSDYLMANREIEPLLKVRDQVLSDIDQLHYCQVDFVAKKRRREDV